ncbi:MAG: ATP-binding protein [Rhodanobacter sp.]
MKILLVEDNEMNRDMLSRRLTRRGHSVVTAVDGQAALDQAASTRPQLVLMDLSLPVIDGWEVTRRLKANALTRSIPVIALSAHAMAGDRQRALAAGCDDFDTKPVDLDRLLAKMEALAGPGGSANPPNEYSAAPAIGGIVLHASCMSDLPALMHMIERACRDAGADDDALFSVRLAAEEVFTNILDYGYPDGTGPITIHIDPQPGQVRISFADLAARFDPAKVPAPRLDAPLQDRAVGGWGWYLVRQVMDKVEWEPRETGGNLFTLTKSLANASTHQPGEHP